MAISYLLNMGKRLLLTFVLANIFLYGGTVIAGKIIDVQEESLAAPAISYVIDAQLMELTPDGLFLPDKAVTMVVFWAVLLRSLNVTIENAPVSTQFPAGITPTNWFAPYLYTAHKLGWITADEYKIFATDRLITTKTANTILDLVNAKARFAHSSDSTVINKAQLAMVMYRIHYRHVLSDKADAKRSRRDFFANLLGQTIKLNYLRPLHHGEKPVVNLFKPAFHYSQQYNGTTYSSSGIAYDLNNRYNSIGFQLQPFQPTTWLAWFIEYSNALTNYFTYSDMNSGNQQWHLSVELPNLLMPAQVDYYNTIHLGGDELFNLYQDQTLQGTLHATLGSVAHTITLEDTQLYNLEGGYDRSSTRLLKYRLDPFEQLSFSTSYTLYDDIEVPIYNTNTSGLDVSYTLPMLYFSASFSTTRHPNYGDVSTAEHSIYGKWATFGNLDQAVTFTRADSYDSDYVYNSYKYQLRYDTPLIIADQAVSFQGSYDLNQYPYVDSYYAVPRDSLTRYYSLSWTFIPVVGTTLVFSYGQTDVMSNISDDIYSQTELSMYGKFDVE